MLGGEEIEILRGNVDGKHGEAVAALIIGNGLQDRDLLLQRSVMNQLSIIISSCNYINSITVFHGDGPVLCVSKNQESSDVPAVSGTERRGSPFASQRGT